MSKTIATAECGATSRVSEHQKTAHVYKMIEKSPCNGCRLTRQDLGSDVFISTNKNTHRRCVFVYAPVAPDIRE